MKIATQTISPSGQKALLFRVNLPELVILRGLVDAAIAHTPIVPGTRDLRQRLRAIRKGFFAEALKEWEEGQEHTRENEFYK